MHNNFNSGFLILVFGFIFFATVFGGGERKLEEVEKMAKITSSFISSVFAVGGLFLALTIPFLLIIGLFMGLSRRLVSLFQSK